MIDQLPVVRYQKLHLRIPLATGDGLLPFSHQAAGDG